MRILKMFILNIKSYILLISVISIDAKSCTSPSNEAGNCVPLIDCKPLLDFVFKKNKTPQDNKFINDSLCGSEINITKVCCPASDGCVTPEGNPGKCVSLYKCNRITAMLSDPSKQDNIDYINKSACNGTEERSVCCGLEPQLTQPNLESMSLNDKCSLEINVFPSEINSTCCGVESSIGTTANGGTLAKKYEYPWHVLILIMKENAAKLHCAGALISSQYVLTSGTCVNIPTVVGTPENVLMGDYDITNKNQRPNCVYGSVDCLKYVIIPIDKIIKHPDFNLSSLHRRHDIGLVRLKTMAPYTDTIRPICLPSVDYVQSLPADTKYVIGEWGRYFSNEIDPMDTGRTKVLNIDRNKCQERLRTISGVSQLTLRDGQMCAGGDNINSCRIKSGGTLLYQTDKGFKLVGIVSYGPTPCQITNMPNVYTNVYKYVPWIRSNIKT